MNDRQYRENERNLRSNNFLIEHQQDFANNTVAAAYISALTQKISKTQTRLQLQPEGKTDDRADYDIVEDAFDELIEEMRSIRDFAQSMVHDISDLDDKFHLPSSKSKRKYLIAAHTAIEEAENFKEQFIDYGMDTDFIDELKKKTEIFEEVLVRIEASTAGQDNLTDIIEDEIAESNKLVESIDPIVRRIYRAAPTKLAAWICATRIERPTLSGKYNQSFEIN